MVTVRKRRDKTGGELGMQEPHSERLANYAELESCAGGGDIAGKALTEALAGRLSSREIPLSRRRPRGRTEWEVGPAHPRSIAVSPEGTFCYTFLKAVARKFL